MGAGVHVVEPAAPQMPEHHMHGRAHVGVEGSVLLHDAVARAQRGRDGAKFVLGLLLPAAVQHARGCARRVLPQRRGGCQRLNGRIIWSDVERRAVVGAAEVVGAPCMRSGLLSCLTSACDGQPQPDRSVGDALSRAMHVGGGVMLPTSKRCDTQKGNHLTGSVAVRGRDRGGGVEGGACLQAPGTQAGDLRARPRPAAQLRS